MGNPFRSVARRIGFPDGPAMDWGRQLPTHWSAPAFRSLTGAVAERTSRTPLVALPPVAPPRYGNLLPPDPGHKAAANCQESQKHRAPRMGKLPMAGVTSSGRASCACAVSLLWGSLILRARAQGRAAGRCPRGLASGTRVWPVCAAATAGGARIRQHSAAQGGAPLAELITDRRPGTRREDRHPATNGEQQITPRRELTI